MQTQHQHIKKILGITVLVLAVAFLAARTLRQAPTATEKSDATAQEPPELLVFTESEPVSSQETAAAATVTIEESGWYNSKDDVALYIYTYSHLPQNYITKAQARALGWNGGSLEKYAAGKSIGGDRFSNREGTLPKSTGRTYTECDIDTQGKKSRGAKRIVFSNDGLIFYTADHYETFELLYGE